MFSVPVWVLAFRKKQQQVSVKRSLPATIVRRVTAHTTSRRYVFVRLLDLQASYLQCRNFCRCSKKGDCSILLFVIRTIV